MKYIYDEFPVVLMCGVSGSGKTYFSKNMENDGYIRLSPDELVWEKYGSSFSDLAFEEQKELFSKAFKDVVVLTIKILKSGKRVVVDSTLCKRFKRDMIREACRENGFEPLIIYFNIPFNTLRQRLSSRANSGPNDLKVSELQLKSFMANFEAPDGDENFIVITSE